MKQKKRVEYEEEKPRITARGFVLAWQTSNSVGEVAKKVRCTKNAARVRACRYRQYGVGLKQFPTVEIEPINWDELATLAREIESGQSVPVDG
jgi:hypothetical protein